MYRSSLSGGIHGVPAWSRNGSWMNFRRSPVPATGVTLIAMGGNRSESRAPLQESLEPDHRRLGQRADPPDRQQHSGHEGLAINRVVANRQRLAHVTEDHLLVGDQPGQSDQVDRYLDASAGGLGHQRRGA